MSCHVAVVIPALRSSMQAVRLGPGLAGILGYCRPRCPGRLLAHTRAQMFAADAQRFGPQSIAYQGGFAR